MSVTGVSSPHLNGQSSQSQPTTESKQADSRSDINQLLKETGDYEDEEEEEEVEDEDSDEIEEEISDDEDEENSKTNPKSISNDCSATAAVFEPEAQPVTTLATEIENFECVVQKNTEIAVDAASIAEAEAFENELNGSVNPVEVQPTVEKQIKEVTTIIFF